MVVNSDMTKLLFILLLVFGNFAFSQCQGDVNEDYNIDVLDVVTLVDVIMISYGEEYIAAGDMNEDGYLNIMDVVQLVNLVLEV